MTTYKIITEIVIGEPLDTNVTWDEKNYYLTIGDLSYETIPIKSDYGDVITRKLRKYKIAELNDRLHDNSN